MATIKLLLLPGDGIGPEVMGQAKRVIDWMNKRGIAKFETEEALRQWRIHPEHARAKRRGIESLFSDYKFQICSVIRARAWTAS